MFPGLGGRSGRRAGKFICPRRLPRTRRPHAGRGGQGRPAWAKIDPPGSHGGRHVGEFDLPAPTGNLPVRLRVAGSVLLRLPTHAQAPDPESRLAVGNTDLTVSGSPKEARAAPRWGLPPPPTDLTLIHWPTLDRSWSSDRRRDSGAPFHAVLADIGCRRQPLRRLEQLLRACGTWQSRPPCPWSWTSARVVGDMNLHLASLNASALKSGSLSLASCRSSCREPGATQPTSRPSPAAPRATIPRGLEGIRPGKQPVGDQGARR